MTYNDILCRYNAILSGHYHLLCGHNDILCRYNDILSGHDDLLCGHSDFLISSPSGEELRGDLMTTLISSSTSG